MAGRKRKSSGSYRAMSSTIPMDLYQELSDWAWAHKMSLSMAIEELLKKALRNESVAE